MLNEKIKALRKANNLTQEELADKLCVSRQAITKWESGLGIPDISNIEAIAKLFGISIDELISNDVKINKDNISRTEFDVFSENDFELDVGTVKNLDLSLIDEEKVIIELHNESDIESFKIAKVKLDDSHDINLKIVKIKLNKKIGRNYSKQDAKKYLSVKVMLPKTLAGRIELFGEPQSLNVHDITAEKHIEFDGKVTDVSVLNSQGHFELTSGIDMEIEYDGSMKQLVQQRL